MTITRDSAVSIAIVRQPVEHLLDEVDACVAHAITSITTFVNPVAGHLLRLGGKRLRPLVVLLTAGICGRKNPRSIQAAALVEILHAATLIHDDVVDGSSTRHGAPSVNALWSNPAAVLAGDYLLSCGLLLCLRNGEYDFLHIVSDAIRRMSEAELLEIHKAALLDMSEQDYDAVIRGKTASLFAACGGLGAASVDATAAQRTRFRAYGENVGMAFQIRDDVLDYVGGQRLGKPVGADIRESKLTLPLIHALNRAPSSDARRVIDLVRAGVAEADVPRILGFIEAYGGIEYSERRAREFGEDARQALRDVPDSPERQALHNFVDFAVERTF